MVLWSLAALVTAIVCAALLVTALRGAKADQAKAAQGEDPATTAFYRTQLAGIETDLVNERLSVAEATAAKAELAREYLRQAAEHGKVGAESRYARYAVVLVLPVIVVASFGVYAAIGRADLPALPLAHRTAEAGAPIAAPSQMSLAEAVVQVEARLAETPGDIRGWQALGPIYMQMGRYDEAANAYRRVLDLEPPTADRETDLAEAMIMAGDGLADEGAMTLLRSAAEREPDHVRSRFYLAGELTRVGDYEEAIPLWRAILDLATGQEAWIPTATAGLQAAETGLAGASAAAPAPSAEADEQAAMIRAMVDGLADRLYSDGGGAEEWVQLVRSRLVLDGRDQAQQDLELGLAALMGDERAQLAAFGTENGLEVTE